MGTIKTKYDIGDVVYTSLGYSVFNTIEKVKITEITYETKMVYYHFEKPKDKSNRNFISEAEVIGTTKEEVIALIDKETEEDLKHITERRIKLLRKLR